MGQAYSVRVRYTLPALADLNSIIEYLADQSPRGAQRIQNRIQVLIELLPLHPRMGARTDDPVMRRVTALPYPFLIFYEATEREIIIHAVRHSSREADQ